MALLYLANGVFCLFVFEAVRRQRVVNVTIPLRRVTILGLSLSIPALLLHEAASHLQEDLGLPGWAWLGVGALFAYIISRIHEFSVEAAERFFNRHLDRIGEELARLDRIGANGRRSRAASDTRAIEAPASDIGRGLPPR